MSVLLSYDHYNLKPRAEQHFREELFVSATDWRRLGAKDGAQFGVLSIGPSFPGEPEHRFPVRLVVDDAVEAGAVHINQNFLLTIGLLPNDRRPWSVESLAAVAPITQATIELVVEQVNVDRELDSLRRERRALFVNRCLLVEPGTKVDQLSLHTGRGYFNIRSLQPAPELFTQSTLLVMGESTTINVFVPHRRSGVDIAIVVDASGSMDRCDYLGADGRVHTRLEGVRVGLDVLFQRKLKSGSRVSRVAAVVFGANTQMLYPPEKLEMVELVDETQIEEIRGCVRNLSRIGLERLKVERGRTNISAALHYGADLLNYFSQEGNEKMIVLLSDGADWSEDTRNISDGEIVGTTQDPAVLADSLHFDSGIRIHTVAISNEQALRRYEERQYWDSKMWVPNTTLLRKVADVSEGLFFEGPDARELAKLFDEIGVGAAYPL